MESAEQGTDEFKDVLTVAELNERIGAVLDDADSLQNVQCLGEVSQVNEYDFGVFIDLVYDGHELTALMWSSRYRELDVELEQGMEIVLTGDVDFYPEDGRVNLKPWEVFVVGDGERSLRLKQLRAELADRGWFEDSHKKPLPRLPSRIGVVTSLDGDARYDIQESIHERYPDVDLVIKDARVQGEHAPESIANGVQTLDRHHDVDVIVVGRGGGSETDLAAFNTEIVAESVFVAETPIVAAVGHKEDSPIVCDVADAVAITPTDVGSIVVEDREELAADLDAMEQRIDRAYESVARETLDDLRRRVDDAYETTVTQRLSALERRVETAFTEQKHSIERRATRRRYGAIIALLVLLLLGMGLFIFVTIL